MLQEMEEKTPIEITLACAKSLSYYFVQNALSPVKRLYIKNNSPQDMEDIKIKVFSTPDFLLPYETEQAVLPRKTTLKFDTQAMLSPLFAVANNSRVDGEIIVQVIQDGAVIAEARNQTCVLAYYECDYKENPEFLASFIRRTAEINALITSVSKKISDWGKTFVLGYSGDKNPARNFFAACYSVLSEKNFMPTFRKGDGEILADTSEILKTKISSELELALILASLTEGNGLNPIVGKINERWYVGCFLSNECLSNTFNDDLSVIYKKLDVAVGDISIVRVKDVFDGVGFEKSEKNAAADVKKNLTSGFFIDVKRARIMRILPLPERIFRNGGYDLVKCEDFSVKNAPRQINEYKGIITGEKDIGRVSQWERKLLDIDMRNALLNFKESRAVIKLAVPDPGTLIQSVFANGRYFIESRPPELTSYENNGDGFSDVDFLKPFSDFIAYEYGNKKLHTFEDGKTTLSALTKLYKKELSVQEETGTSTLYLAIGFLKWRENETCDFKYAPLLLYPALLTKKGASIPSFTVDLNNEDVQINSTLLEFLYREFNLDMRGLQSVKFENPSDALTVLARIKREVVNFKGWEVLPTVYLTGLSFANYRLWYDIKYKPERFFEHPVVNSLISNRLQIDTVEHERTSKSSDEAYSNGSDKLFLPISADSSQYSAIYDSLDKSFVLHGPPGTGKSQTITNIIANNIARGKRVLFVAEKMAALSVVRKRLQTIGLDDFCLELHSNKTNKTDVLNRIIKTLSLTETKSESSLYSKAEEIKIYLDKLGNELDAVHRKRFLGFSLYEAILNYFENQDAPDCLHIDSLFYEKLTESSFNLYTDALTELTLRAKECGDIDKSPFNHIGAFEYSEKWRDSGEAALEVYAIELRHLRQYAKTLLPLFDMRTVSLTTAKIDALYNISKLLKSNYVISYFKNCKTVDGAKGIVDGFNEAYRKNTALTNEFLSVYGAYPQNVNVKDLEDAVKNRDYPRSVKKLFPLSLEKKDRAIFAEFLLKCELNKTILSHRAEDLSALFELSVASVPAVNECAAKITALYNYAAKLYADFDVNVFDGCCMKLTANQPGLYTEYYVSAYDNAERARAAFTRIFNVDNYSSEDLSGKIDFVANIQKNIDAIPCWCKYQEMVTACRNNGLDFVIEPLNAGEISATDVLRCFKKRVYGNFIKSELYLDDVLCQFSGLTLEETAYKFKVLAEEYERLTRKELRSLLTERLPRTDTAGEHNLERVMLMRAEKTGMKGTTLRNLFSSIPNLLKSTCPCMMMSPASVSQFLDIDADKFDLLIFDEASQIPTCKAVACIARAKNVIVVGDPKQLPPTTFFGAEFKDDEHYDVEDLDSILDDCLAIGLPEKRLLWHYRSNHESLIAFSNATFYDNELLTFPSPGEMNSKVSFKYVDGVYDRGGTKCNKKEADELVNEVIKRLKNTAFASESIGIVTFNTAQQNYIEAALTKRISQENLESAAFAVDEPLFVKNLESVQGDERDVILFSIGYGPDAQGKLSLNFGPINQAGGYKRLNVAVTRARNEMCVFSAITGNMLDLTRSDSKGVAGLKAFLEYAERGKEMLAFNGAKINKEQTGVGAVVAADLKDRGMLCDYNVGVSGFKIDVAVVDPRDKNRYILAVIIDSENALKLNGVRDRVAMQTQILKKLGWNTYRLWTVNYFNNPKREISKIKDTVIALTEKKVMTKKKTVEILSRYRKPYKSYYSKPFVKSGVDYVLDFVNEDKIIGKIRDTISTESPIERGNLLDKLLVMYNVPKSSKKAVSILEGYITSLAGLEQTCGDRVFYVDKQVDFFRPQNAKTVRDISKVHPGEITAAAKCAIEIRQNLTKDELTKEILSMFNIPKKTRQATEWIENAVNSAITENVIMVTVDGVLAV